MTCSIALAGKGGTGKTTVAGLIVDYLVKAGKGPILAVDADANSNLNEVLGIERPLTLGDIREEIARAEIEEKNPIPANMSKQEYMDYRFGSALVEENNFDMLVMGRTQGKGCYCFVNDILREQLKKYYQNYNYLVVDNEAGLEHISRITKSEVILDNGKSIPLSRRLYRKVNLAFIGYHKTGDKELFNLFIDGS
jgi:CO dehydrogenase maturation factor